MSFGEALVAVLLVAFNAAVNPLEWPWWWTVAVLLLLAATVWSWRSGRKW